MTGYETNSIEYRVIENTIDYLNLVTNSSLVLLSNIHQIFHLSE
jgi:hypothetical protein